MYFVELGLALAITPRGLIPDGTQTGEKVSVRALRGRPTHHVFNCDLARGAPEFGIRVVLFLFITETFRPPLLPVSLLPPCTPKRYGPVTLLQHETR